MRLVLLDLPGARRIHFDPVALSRPIFSLRCGMTSLCEKLIAHSRATDVACFVPPYMADVYRAQCNWPVNDPASLSGSDLLLVDGRVQADQLASLVPGPSQVLVDATGEPLVVTINRTDLDRLSTDSVESLLSSAQQILPVSQRSLATWDYAWDLILANPSQLASDFRSAGRQGVEGTVETPHALRGDSQDVYIAPTAVIHPMVVIDTERGPVYIDEGAEVHPFTRIEGPCYVGQQSTLLGASCRAGNSIGPYCRLGGEVEASILHGYSNKYHEGFLGHAYLGEWVNLGALTTNSDLKNDYSNVTVVLDGLVSIDTGSRKVGSLIGDHTKTAIGTLFNTGAYVGPMGVISGTGTPLPKFIPAFAWFYEGAVTEGFGKAKLFETARTVMARRDCEWTTAHESMWDAIFDFTKAVRDDYIERGSSAGGSRRR